MVLLLLSRELVLLLFVAAVCTVASSSPPPASTYYRLTYLYRPSRQHAVDHSAVREALAAVLQRASNSSTPAPVVSIVVEELELERSTDDGHIVGATVSGGSDDSTLRSACAAAPSSQWAPAEATREIRRAMPASGEGELALLHCVALVPRDPLFAGSRRQDAPPSPSPPPEIARGSQYHSTAAIFRRMEALRVMYPMLVALFDVGDSIEAAGSVRALRITSSPNPQVDDPGKPDLLLVGTHHAREWISAEVPMAIAELLCSLYTYNRRVRQLLDDVEVVVVPIVNPDGYEYSRQQPSHRYWRKNRRPIEGTAEFGVDLNRNYPLYWGKENGASTNPSDNTYRGAEASSEPEVRAMIEGLFQSKIDPHLIADAPEQDSPLLAPAVSDLHFYASYHNYGAEMLWPFGDTADNYSPTEALMRGLFTEAAGAVMGEAAPGATQSYAAKKASGAYPVSGDAVDYVHQRWQHAPGVTVELRPSVGKCCGFVLAESEINATVLENLAFVLYVAEYGAASSKVAFGGHRSRSAAFGAGMAPGSIPLSWWKRSQTDVAGEAFVPSRVRELTAANTTAYEWFLDCPDGSGTSEPLVDARSPFRSLADVDVEAQRQTTRDRYAGTHHCTSPGLNHDGYRLHLPSVLGVNGHSVPLRLFAAVPMSHPASATLDSPGLDPSVQYVAPPVVGTDVAKQSRLLTALDVAECSATDGVREAVQAAFIASAQTRNVGDGVEEQESNEQWAARMRTDVSVALPFVGWGVRSENSGATPQQATCAVDIVFRGGAPSDYQRLAEGAAGALLRGTFDGLPLHGAAAEMRHYVSLIPAAADYSSLAAAVPYSANWTLSASAANEGGGGRLELSHAALLDSGWWTTPPRLLLVSSVVLLIAGLQ